MFGSQLPSCLQGLWRVLKNTVLDGRSLASAILLPIPSLQSQCLSPHPIRKVPRATLVLLLNGDRDCILLSIARANLQAPKSNAGPNARGSRGCVLFSSACMLVSACMAACCRLTRAEGRNRGSRLEHGAVAAAEGHTWCNGQDKRLRRSAAWLRFLGSLRPTHVAPSFFRNRPFRRENPFSKTLSNPKLKLIRSVNEKRPMSFNFELWKELWKRHWRWDWLYFLN